jgi:glycosyltransferase involved in cell wall biosynthesis
MSPGARQSISVVTPTFGRPDEVRDLILNLDTQNLLPSELIVVDGAPPHDRRTESEVRDLVGTTRYCVRYVRSAQGTALQRNAGIDLARGDLVAFVDDDVRLDPHFFEVMAAALDNDASVGGVVGYRTNVAFTPDSAERWRWYRRLKLLSTFEPGRYDRRCGYPINNNLQPRFSGVREVDFMTTACALWRRAVFDEGMRFDPWFAGFGVLEDAHFSLRAGKRWKLLQCGDATCQELHAAGGRTDDVRIGYKTIVNYYYVFTSVEGPLSRAQRFRFWRFQAFELFRLATSLVRRRRRVDIDRLRGRIRGIIDVATGRAP